MKYYDNLDEISSDIDRNRAYSYYDIHGFVIAVDNEVNSAFFREYNRFLKKEKPGKIDLYIKKSNKKLPITLPKDNKGISIPFNGNTVYFENGVWGDWLLYTIEPLIEWEDKCFLHCGAVEKDGNAYLFPAKSGVGKTSLATHLISRGYNYLADDWLIVGNKKAYPFFKTFHIYDYNLKDKKLAKKALGFKRFYYRNLIRLMDILAFILRHRFVKIAVERFKPVFSVDVEDMFPGRLGKISKINRVFLLETNNKNGEIFLEKIKASEIVTKMKYIWLNEANHFYRNYFEYAYDNGIVDKIEKRVEKDGKIMLDCFSEAETYKLYIPRHINPEKVYEKIRGLLQ